ncbi:MAG TPA: methyltransferase [Cellvibrio sp.]|nr:methyltransferase [Cellvibrio sp.]
MIDTSSQWLIQQMQQCQQGNNLWCCDENLLRQLANSEHWSHKPQFISNRWDIAQQAEQLGFSSEFNDFDLSAIADNSLDHFFYRISKEKAVTHHLINQALRSLKPQGVLWLCGQKNEGVKTYIEKACTLFGSERKLQKDGSNYFSSIVKQTEVNRLLDDDKYTELRPCLAIGEQLIYSKPGQFGWNKIDQGSSFLMAEVNRRLQGQTLASCLDLGCGYGFLSIASRGLDINRRVLTDNNAAALLSARRNCEQLGIAAEVIASDAGQQLQEQFDLILCNPPFHQGFSVDGDLTDKFLNGAKKLMSRQGVSYFVVNQFIPLEKKALQHFNRVTLIAHNKSFKIIELGQS